VSTDSLHCKSVNDRGGSTNVSSSAFHAWIGIRLTLVIGVRTWLFRCLCLGVFARVCACVRVCLVGWVRGLVWLCVWVCGWVWGWERGREEGRVVGLVEEGADTV